MRLQKLQIALFFGEPFITSEVQRSQLILNAARDEAFHAVFNLDPEAVPVPFNIGAPAEIPRVILKGHGNLSLPITQIRADIVCSIAEDLVPDGVEEKLESFGETGRMALDFLQTNGAARVNRLGYVVELGHDLAQDTDAAAYIGEQFFNDKTQNPKELTFRYNSVGRTVIGGNEKVLNQIVQIAAKHDSDTVSLQLDINTLREDTANTTFDAGALMEFQRYARTKIQFLLRNFPERLLN